MGSCKVLKGYITVNELSLRDFNFRFTSLLTSFFNIVYSKKTNRARFSLIAAALPSFALYSKQRAKSCVYFKTFRVHQIQHV